MTDLTTPTPDPDAEVKTAAMVALVAQGSRVLAEAVRGHRAGGPTASFELVNTSGVPVLGIMAAALNACASLAEALCEASGDDVDDLLAGWVDQALGNERDALAHLTEINSGGGEGS